MVSMTAFRIYYRFVAMSMKEGGAAYCLLLAVYFAFAAGVLDKTKLPRGRAF